MATNRLSSSSQRCAATGCGPLLSAPRGNAHIRRAAGIPPRPSRAQPRRSCNTPADLQPASEPACHSAREGRQARAPLSLCCCGEVAAGQHTSAVRQSPPLCAAGV
ncbi:hypothetical protein EON67_02375 [archaeon]|nr:MAG: hypothetical protein EON67_02375 [archaeon]